MLSRWLPADTCIHNSLLQSIFIYFYSVLLLTSVCLQVMASFLPKNCLLHMAIERSLVFSLTPQHLPPEATTIY